GSLQVPVSLSRGRPLEASTSDVIDPELSMRKKMLEGTPFTVKKRSSGSMSVALTRFVEDEVNGSAVCPHAGTAASVARTPRLTRWRMARLLRTNGGIRRQS